MADKFGDDAERQLKMALMMADIANKETDTNLKTEQLRWEPWKALSAAFGAGIAVATALIGTAAWVLQHFLHT